MSELGDENRQEILRRLRWLDDEANSHGRGTRGKREWLLFMGPNVYFRFHDAYQHESFHTPFGKVEISINPGTPPGWCLLVGFVNAASCTWVSQWFMAPETVRQDEQPDPTHRPSEV